MKVSIVTTMYQSGQYVEEFYHRSLAAVKRIADEYEFVFVNDGSPDDSLSVALALQKKDPRIRVIELSRNWGHHKAIVAGLEHARGERIFLIDVDLEEPPELLGEFLRVMQEADADVVYGVQISRKGGFVERVGGEVFFRVFNRMSKCPIPRNFVTARLMTRAYVRASLCFRDREIFIGGLWALTGFRQVGHPVEKGSRQGSSYSLSRRVSLLVNGITAFSSRPLEYVCGLGLTVTAGACLVAFVVLFLRLFIMNFRMGWPSLLVSIWVLGGLQLFCIGVIGVYVAKVYTEAKERPLYVVRRVYEGREGESHVDA